jgi:hypothetical protein
MAKHPLSNNEKDILKVIKNEIDYAQDTPSLKTTKTILDARISESEDLLRSIGRGTELLGLSTQLVEQAPRALIVRSFDELLADAQQKYPDDIGFEDILTDNELAENAEHIKQLNAEFNTIHKLDPLDVIIPVVAGILSGAIDCVFGGFVKDGAGRNVPGSMSEFVSELFNKALPAERIEKLEGLAKVPYDALNYDNKGNVIVEEIVDGLSPIFHHEVSLGHDPILGFIFGVLDMMRGSVTTIDFNGKFLIQTAEGFSDRKAQNLFQAIATVFLHMLSDVSGSSSARNGGMGLPVPFMALFNKLQFGKVGDNGTISELVKSMFYQGYDFRHFCSMSIPVMITEVVVRVSYFAKRTHEGYSFAEAVPVGISHTEKPKLATMLFIAHTASTAINAGKVAFTRNPLNINYPQWLLFARYSVKQLKWALVDEPALRDKYVLGVIEDEWNELTERIDGLWDEFSDGAAVVYV